MKVKLLSHVQLFVTPWTIALQAPPSMGFSRQEYWSGLLVPSPMTPYFLNEPLLLYVRDCCLSRNPETHTCCHCCFQGMRHFKHKVK